MAENVRMGTKKNFAQGSQKEIERVGFKNQHVLVNVLLGAVQNFGHRGSPSLTIENGRWNLISTGFLISFLAVLTLDNP